MLSTTDPTTNPRTAQIRQVLGTTLVANLLVAAGKMIVGLMTASIAMVADGIHSLMDATSNVVGLVGTALAARPPDEEHPYGHRRFETLASLVIGGVLLLTAWEVIQTSIDRLLNPVEPRITVVNFAVMIVSLGVSAVVSHYERREGERLNAEILLADAEHTRSDVLVSLAVIASLIAAQSGLVWVDPLAALAVVVLIGLSAWRITSRSAGILVDRAPLDAGSVSGVVAEVPGIDEVLQVRSRGPVDAIHVDIDLAVAAPVTADHSAQIEREVSDRVTARFEGVDEVRVRFRPQRDDPPNFALIARAEADALGLAVHEVTAIAGKHGLKLEMHVEVRPDASVGEAHAVVTEFEERLRERVRGVSQVLTHIEPAPLDEDPPRYDDSAEGLIEDAIAIAQQEYPAAHWHEVSIYAEPDGGYTLTMHSGVPGSMPITEAHHMAEEVEVAIRAALPRVHRVTIHTEPPEG